MYLIFRRKIRLFLTLDHRHRSQPFDNSHNTLITLWYQCYQAHFTDEESICLISQRQVWQSRDLNPRNLARQSVLPNIIDSAYPVMSMSRHIPHLRSDLLQISTVCFFCPQPLENCHGSYSLFFCGKLVPNTDSGKKYVTFMNKNQIFPYIRSQYRCVQLKKHTHAHSP